MRVMGRSVHMKDDVTKEARISIFVNETAEAIKAEKRRKDAREDRINYLKHVIGNLDRRGNATTPGTSEKTDG
ncbi:hypothetical protein Smp_153370 [Schistosoma mansoni]|uniref:hypothetical protein n=1 Tax=Schistosoma mansoni TaxID=6183 RepID=UPI0001A6396C|nr:hypothetical protein Smp_153370 [Schistosoma mansoni]|eukprot:XP_018652638.1 hypothetical protein Smp_153370 [Schistosoma mansoni]